MNQVIHGSSLVSPNPKSGGSNFKIEVSSNCRVCGVPMVPAGRRLAGDCWSALRARQRNRGGAPGV